MNDKILNFQNNDFEITKKIKNVYKTEIYSKFENTPKKLIQQLIKQLIIEYNNKENTIIPLSLYSHSVPYFIYKKIVLFFTDN